MISESSSNMFKRKMFRLKMFCLRRAMSSLWAPMIMGSLIILLMLSMFSRFREQIISPKTDYHPVRKLLVDNDIPIDSTQQHLSDMCATNACKDPKQLIPDIASHRIVNNITLQDATSSKHTTFRIINREQTYQCNQLKIEIQTRNHLNHLKHHGGDYFWVWIRNLEQNASAAADHIIDHGNGTYTALMTLFWDGAVDINVTLVHSREAIGILNRIRDNSKVPRNAYQGTFKNENKKVIKPCHISTNMFMYPYTRSGKKLKTPSQFCNFTDSKSGFPWFCVKPDGFPCESYHLHGTQSDSYKKAKATFRSLLTQEEHDIVMDSLGRIKIDPDSTNNINVNPYKGSHDHASHDQRCLRTTLLSCDPGMPPKRSGLVAGHYYKNMWKSNVCLNKDFITAASIRECLQHKDIHFYGDSTGRQWFEYLIENLKKTGTVHQNITHRKTGPIFAFDMTSNISVSFHFHGFPFATGATDVSNIDYVANRIDNIKTGPEPIIFISMWAHFWILDTTFYRKRLQSVKDALTRLKTRSPGAKVFFKTPNTSATSAKGWGMGMNIWYVVELDRVLREELDNFLDVTVIDVWDMTLGHVSGVHIHPREVVVEQEVSMLLSFLCTKNK